MASLQVQSTVNEQIQTDTVAGSLQCGQCRDCSIGNRLGITVDHQFLVSKADLELHPVVGRRLDEPGVVEALGVVLDSTDLVAGLVGNLQIQSTETSLAVQLIGMVRFARDQARVLTDLYQIDVLVQSQRSSNILHVVDQDSGRSHQGSIDELVGVGLGNVRNQLGRFGFNQSVVTERFQRVGHLPVKCVGRGVTARTLEQQQTRNFHVQCSLVGVHDVGRIPCFSIGVLASSANVPAGSVGSDHSQVFGFESFQAQDQVLVHGVIAATVATQTRDGNVIGTFSADVGISGLTVEITQVTTAHETDSGSFQRNWRNLYRIAFLIDGT